MTVTKQKEISIWCRKEDFEEILRDERIYSIVTLARILNTITYIEQSFPKDMNGRVQDRIQTFSGFFYLSAVLFEALEFAQTKLGKHFNDWTVYQKGFAKLLGDKQTKKFREKVLKPLRNQAVYHHNEEVPREAVRFHRGDSVKFCAFPEGDTKTIHYDLADQVVFQFAFSETRGPDVTEAAVYCAAKQVMGLGSSFRKEGTLLISEFLQRNKAWRFSEEGYSL